MNERNKKPQADTKVYLSKKQYYALLGTLVGLVILVILSFTLEGEEEEELSHERNFKEKYSIFSLTIPDSVSFAGENVPVDFFDVKESLDRELLVNTYWQSQTLLFIKRSYRYFPVIEPILEKHNIPEDFKYLAIAESGLTNVISPANAAGIWQFLEGTARDYGLEVNRQVDERYHLEKATEAACEFFLESHETYRNWTLVAASYNRGRNGINQKIAQQKSDNYFDLALNDETSRYVYRIIAIKMILENPTKYGFYVRKKDVYPPLSYQEVRVDSTINDLSDFARGLNINYKLLKLYNPWLMDDHLRNSRKKTYVFKIPDEDERSMSPGVQTTNLQEEKQD